MGYILTEELAGRTRSRLEVRGFANQGVSVNWINRFQLRHYEIKIETTHALKASRDKKANKDTVRDFQRLHIQAQNIADKANLVKTRFPWECRNKKNRMKRIGEHGFGVSRRICYRCWSTPNTDGHTQR